MAPLGVLPAPMAPRVRAVAGDARLARAAHAASSCVQAAFDIEQETGIPIGLLLAVGRIESGRADPVTGRVAPWPWTTNSAGVGRFFESKDDAMQYVRDQQARGVQSVDVGCFQVNLFYHPQAFASLDDAFDPVKNARYAASFLLELLGRSGAWESAVGLYHSAVPEQGGWYRDRVLASWNGGEMVVAPSLRASFAAKPHMSDPSLVLSVKAFGIQVWTPGSLAGAARGPGPVIIPMGRRGPQVSAP